MKTFRIEKKIMANKTLHLDNLPFSEGEEVEVIILGREDNGAETEASQTQENWLDTEYIEYAKKAGDSTISLESVQKALAGIKEDMGKLIIAEREDRF